MHVEITGKLQVLILRYLAHFIWWGIFVGLKLHRVAQASWTVSSSHPTGITGACCHAWKFYRVSGNWTHTHEVNTLQTEPSPQANLLVFDTVYSEWERWELWIPLASIHTSSGSKWGRHRLEGRTSGFNFMLSWVFQLESESFENLKMLLFTATAAPGMWLVWGKQLLSDRQKD